MLTVMVESCDMYVLSCVLTVATVLSDHQGLELQVSIRIDLIHPNTWEKMWL